MTVNSADALSADAGANEAPKEGNPEELDAAMQASTDGGDELLRGLMPSADPEWIRDQLQVARTAKAEGLEAVWPIHSTVHVDPAELQAFSAQFSAVLGGKALTVDEAKDVSFQTKEDWHHYAFAPGAIGYHTGTMKVSPPMWKSFADPAAALTHQVAAEHDPAAAPLRLGLFADFGNGTYPTQAIARQLAAASYPYAFHLGDVYYGGTTDEFDRFFRKPLSPMLGSTELFMLAGNHELYAKGVNFQSFIREKYAQHPGVQRQNAEMFRLKGEGFQIIGVDTMWTHWKGGTPRATARIDPEALPILQQWAKEGAGGLTILLTSDNPWDVGSGGTTKLLQDLIGLVGGGCIDLWFWGNVHYAALYERFQAPLSPSHGFIGSCIGHGGYPFYTMKQGKLPHGVGLRWLETRHRFWPYMKTRPDVGLQGYCELVLSRQSGSWQVGLHYKDWVGRTAAVAEIVKPDGKGAQIASFTGPT